MSSPYVLRLAAAGAGALTVAAAGVLGWRLADAIRLVGGTGALPSGRG